MNPLSIDPHDLASASLLIIRLRDALRMANEKVAELESRLHGAESANAAIEIAEHAELNGHVDVVEQWRDWLASSLMDRSGKVEDFVTSLRVVLDQFDRSRRRLNWFEVAYTAGKQKLIESAIEKRLGSVRTAVRAFVACVDGIGAIVDDDHPRATATAQAIGAAQSDLWTALGLDHGEEHARLLAEIDSRCAVCGWVLAKSVVGGCVRGNCSLRPRPASLYAPERAAKEEHELALRNGMPPSGRWA